LQASARHEEQEARLSIEGAKRAHEEYEAALERLVEAERRRLEAIRMQESQLQEDARRKLTQVGHKTLIFL
jgi:hypothetical protein